jgi:hypothetical protein
MNNELVFLVRGALAMTLHLSSRGGRQADDAIHLFDGEICGLIRFVRNSGRFGEVG